MKSGSNTKEREVSTSLNKFIWIGCKHKLSKVHFIKFKKTEDVTHNFSYVSLLSYSLIAFDERVTSWLQRVRSLPRACAYVALFARRLAYNHYAIPHAYSATNAHAQDSDRRVETKKLLSRRRQSEYSSFFRLATFTSYHHPFVSTWACEA